MLVGCTIVLLVGGGFVEHSPSPNIEHLRATGARVIEQNYPLHDAATAYTSVDRPRSVLFGESAGGSIAAWAAAHGRARAAVTVGAPFDFRFWQPDNPAFHGQPWRWSPRRVYRGQRPLTAIHWTDDPVVEVSPPLIGARLVSVRGLGHHNLPRGVLVRELGRACATPLATARAAPPRAPSARRRTTRPSRGSSARPLP